MQKAEVVLSILSQKSTQNSAYVFDRLYRNLFNPDFYRLASSNIDAKEGHMPAGVDGEAVDGFTVHAVEEIIAQLKRETYYPQPVARASVLQKRGTPSQPALPSLQDRLVQEVIRLLLQAIYEPVFTDASHGFRPGRSCHTALMQLKTTGRGTHWVIEGDLTECLEHVDHTRLLAVLSRTISDGRLMNLINRFLRAGYLACWPVRNSLAPMPRGGSVSPILANISVHGLDLFMEHMCTQLTAQGVTAENNLAAREHSLGRLSARGNEEEGQTSTRPGRSLHSQGPFHPGDQRISYIRYAGEFVVMIAGGKRLAEQVREGVRDFLERELQLELPGEKTTLTNLADGRARFLGYEIARGDRQRASSGALQLLVPGDVIRERLKPFVSNGKAIHHNARINIPLLDILKRYNAEIRGLYTYYSLATDVSKKLGTFRYYHYYSLLKTVARKEQCSVARVLSKYGVDVKQKQQTGTRRIFGVSYQTREGPRILTYFNESLRKRDEPIGGNIARRVPGVALPERCQTLERADTRECELCGRREMECTTLIIPPGVSGAPVPELDLAMRSPGTRTLVVCNACLHAIRSGHHQEHL